jgi:hypothetical protein
MALTGSRDSVKRPNILGFCWKQPMYISTPQFLSFIYQTLSKTIYLSVDCSSRCFPSMQSFMNIAKSEDGVTVR